MEEEPADSGQSLIGIRPETPADFASIREVNDRAFGSPAEAGLVDALRGNGHALVSLVAEREGRVVGHVMFSPLTVDAPNGQRSVSIALGPLAVLPDYQRQGVGSALAVRGLEACRNLGYGYVFVLGHPTYYPRFGFTPARTREIIYQDGRDSFMVVELGPGALAGVRGTASYGPEFDNLGVPRP